MREQSVHVHEDEDSVDSRNQLMHQYVLFVAALAPQVFLFENVRHFQAVVKSEGIEFDAADILAEAIESVSTRGLGYAVSRRIVVASQHAVPQARERFVMAGVRKDLSNHLSGTDAASWCLSLQRREPVPLQVALEGLPEPEFSNQDTQQSALAKYEDFQTITAPDGNQASDVFRNWAFRGPSVDAHLARPPDRMMEPSLHLWALENGGWTIAVMMPPHFKGLQRFSHRFGMPWRPHQISVRGWASHRKKSKASPKSRTAP
ncbi:DNA cytosine methyltransferase [Pseudomonas aeruginosa]|nr:DNA cytosine methyltransferase [Pseudomonas aeruginosa]